MQKISSCDLTCYWRARRVLGEQLSLRIFRWTQNLRQWYRYISNYTLLNGKDVTAVGIPILRPKNMDPALRLCYQIISLTVWIGLSIAMIVMGAIYKNDCPIQPYIPIFLLVTGITHLVAIFVLFLRIVLETCSLVLEALLGTFSFAWFIAGCVWVFKLYNYYEGFCNQSLYLFAFGILIFECVMIFLSMIAPCFGCSTRTLLYER
ncbi:transmembrane protein 272-like isoform X2 [Pseudophryne corroboree]